MDTYESWCDTHGTYPLQPDLTGCPYCRIEQLEEDRDNWKRAAEVHARTVLSQEAQVEGVRDVVRDCRDRGSNESIEWMDDIDFALEVKK